MAVKPGFIYVLVHPSDQHLIKVGMTTRSPQVRLREHNSLFDKAAGRVVKATGQEWVLKESFEVEDTYYAESAFFHRSPLTEIPYALSDEFIRLDGRFLTWDWVNEGLELAKTVGIRANTSEPPIPMPSPQKGARWIESKLKDSGLVPVKGFGNGITKVAFRCPYGHEFMISGNSIAKCPYCPLCEPEQFDEYTLRKVDFSSSD